MAMCECEVPSTPTTSRQFPGIEGWWGRCRICNAWIQLPELRIVTQTKDGSKRIRYEQSQSSEPSHTIFLEDSDPSSESEEDDRERDPAFGQASKRDPAAAKRAIKAKKRVSRASKKERHWKPGDPGYVYIMRKVVNGVAQLKFGHAVNPKKRRSALQTGSAERLEVVACVWCRDNQALERQLKKKYDGDNLRLGGGTEFFDPVVLDEVVQLYGFQPWTLSTIV